MQTREEAESFVVGKALQLTLRRMQVLFARPVTLVTLVVIAVVLGISGPFGTYQLFALGPRLAFWLVMSVATFGVGYLGGSLAMALVGPRASYLVTVVSVGIAAGLPVTLVVVLITTLASPGFVIEPGWAATMLVSCLAISTGIAAIFATFRRASDAQAGPQPAGQPAAQSAPLPRTPRLLDRLPPAQRGELVSLSVSDHYVEVVTTRGRSLLLMRLGDAMAEADCVAGVQIHRSHWVALDKVVRARRSGGKVSLETSAGDRLPVSRSFLPAVRQAGLLS